LGLNQHGEQHPEQLHLTLNFKTMKKLILTALLAPFMAFGQYSPADDVKSSENRLLTIEISLFEYRQERNEGLGFMLVGAAAYTLGAYLSENPKNATMTRSFYFFGTGFTALGAGKVLMATRHFKKLKP
jgi:hypothetical protein